jgi:hypothetical protein
LLTPIQFGKQLSPAPAESPFLLEKPASPTNGDEVNSIPSSQPPSKPRKIPALLVVVQLRGAGKSLASKKQVGGGIVARSRSQECNGKEEELPSKEKDDESRHGTILRLAQEVAKPWEHYHQI